MPKMKWRKCRNPKEWVCDTCGECGGCNQCRSKDMYHKDRSEEAICAFCRGHQEKHAQTRSSAG